MKNQVKQFGEFINEAKKPEDLKKKFIEFDESRLAGATTIAETAKEKGGNALLTYNHFVVKLPYYKKAAKGWSEKDKDAAIKEYSSLLVDLYSTKKNLKIKQLDFQKLVGKIEVLGELIIKYNEIY
jgi:CRISPR/Cas system CMR-associated protein Cmr1 (group 7 of RAMP superfamily)